MAPLFFSMRDWIMWISVSHILLIARWINLGYGRAMLKKWVLVYWPSLSISMTCNLSISMICILLHKLICQNIVNRSSFLFSHETIGIHKISLCIKNQTSWSYDILWKANKDYYMFFLRKNNIFHIK